jgi:hypothetical protein
MERAAPSDREAFAAALHGDGLSFLAGHDGDIQVSDPSHGPAPALALRRERQDPAGAVTLLVSIDAGQTAWLALSVVATEYAADGTLMEPRTLVTPVMKSSTGEFFVQTHVGRLLAAGEYTRYFWTLAGAHLGLDG